MVSKKVSMTEGWGIRVERAKGKARASGRQRRDCALDDLMGRTNSREVENGQAVDLRLAEACQEQDAENN
jgi:hypothetical protein